jgi:hypothetical protein
MKASVYAAARKAGKSVDESAEIARLALFDYDSAPLAVQFAARSGIEPFGRYRALSTWRLLTNLYDAPARTARYYRVPDAAVSNFAPDMDGERQKTAMQGMDYLLKKLPYPLFEDGEGRTWWSPLMSIMPEGAAVDMISDANSTNFLGVVPIPPIAQLAMSVFVGVGFRGRNPYEGLVERGGFFEAAHADPLEAGRRAVKEIWRFVAYPWAVGSVTSEQLAKSIAANARSEDDLAQEAGFETGLEFREKAFRLLADGPFAVGYGEGALPLTAATAYSEPPTPLPLAAARFVGLKSYPVQPDPGKLGSANRLLFDQQADLEAKVDYLERLLTNAKLNGMSDAAWEAFRRSRIPELQRMKAQLQQLAARLKDDDGLR